MRDGSEPRRRGLIRTLTLALLLAGLAATGGCSEDRDAGDDIGPSYIAPRTLPADLVRNFQTAYKNRDVVEYAKLLGNDFQFWFDPATRSVSGELPEFWTRLQDSTGTGALFASEQISNVKIELTYSPDIPDNRVGHERWRKIEVTDTYLSLDVAAQDGGEPTTLIVDGDLQHFYLRRGFTEGDTLPGSPTAGEWFLVEWRDLARQRLSAPGAARPTAVERTTWSGIKGSFRR